ncbi:MAG: CbrC family protein [Clostridium sp.]|nr:CbrC family protein [Clostridium sp.]
MYCIENVNCICLECIANSKAAEKFEVSLFNIQMQKFLIKAR